MTNILITPVSVFAVLSNELSPALVSYHIDNPPPSPDGLIFAVARGGGLVEYGTAIYPPSKVGEMRLFHCFPPTLTGSVMWKKEGGVLLRCLGDGCGWDVV